jgi:hypothetical protein
MQLTLSRNVNNTTQTTVDQLEIHYRNTPTVFQVSEVLYNQQSIFTKDASAQIQ